eukprot:8502263-Ditylum_brightwellii.AAC.1
MIKLNNYLEFFLVSGRVTATKNAREEFIDVLEDGVPYQWKLDFKKEGFGLSSSTLKEFLDMCIHLEEAELQKLLKERIACVIKEQDELDDKKKTKPCYKKRKGQTKRYKRRILRQQSKQHGGKQRKKY